MRGHDQLISDCFFAASPCVEAFAFCHLRIRSNGRCISGRYLGGHRPTHPIKVTQSARLIELDAPARIEAELAAHLPTGPQQATAIVQRRLKDGGTDLHRRLATAYQGVIDAWRLGIAKIPTVVVDQRYVVYGETDVDRAVSRIEQFRRSRP